MSARWASHTEHVVTGPSGVWTVDAKVWRGKIEYQTISIFGINTQLYVSEREHTSLVEAICNQIILVALAIRVRAFSISAAMVVIDGEWSTASHPRPLANTSCQHRGARITPPRPLVKMAILPRTQSAQKVRRLTKRADAVLKSTLAWELLDRGARCT